MMNKLFSVLMVVFLVSVASCSQAQNAQKSNDENLNTVEKKSATIDQQGDYFFIMFDDEPNTRYLDTDLASHYCKDKMRVIVSGQKLPIPPNVRMAGNPFKITMIEKDGGIAVESKATTTATQELIEGEGVVKKEGDVFVIETTETIYVPRKMAENYQREGMRVAFTAKKLPIPPNVRLIGLPIEVVTMNTSLKSKKLKNKQLKKFQRNTKIKTKTKMN